MPATGNETLQQEFAQNILQLTQQMQSALIASVATDETHGKQKRYTNIAKVTATKKQQRHATTPNTPATLSNVWTTQEMWEAQDWIDRFDDARSILGNLTSELNISFVSALNRVIDAVALRSLGGPVTTGETGGSTVSIAAAQQIAVSSRKYDPKQGTGDVALTVYKLQQAAEKIGGAGGTFDGVYQVALPWSQLMSLASDARFASWLYNQNRPVGSGSFRGQWMNYVFNTYEDSLKSTANYTLDSSADELVYVYAREAVKLDFAERLFTRVIEDKDHSFDTDVYASTMVGGARRDLSKVIQIACDPTGLLL